MTSISGRVWNSRAVRSHSSRPEWKPRVQLSCIAVIVPCQDVLAKCFCENIQPQARRVKQSSDPSFGNCPLLPMTTHLHGREWPDAHDLMDLPFDDFEGAKTFRKNILTWDNHGDTRKLNPGLPLRAGRVRTDRAAVPDSSRNGGHL